MKRYRCPECARTFARRRDRMAHQGARGHKSGEAALWVARWQATHRPADEVPIRRFMRLMRRALMESLFISVFGRSGGAHS